MLKGKIKSHFGDETPTLTYTIQTHYKGTG